MKIITICAAVGLAVASLGSSANASVQQGYGQQDYGHRGGDDRGRSDHDNGREHGDRRNYGDEGRGYGDRGHGYRGGRGHGRCHMERHHHRMVRVCR